MYVRREYDVGIIGAGAAGLIAAGVCGAADLRVLLLEGKGKPGRKLLTTGGGRCNISNVNIRYTDYNCPHPRTVKNVLAAFSPLKTAAFFKKIGVLLIQEPDGNLFPVSQSAKEVLEALLRHLPDTVELHTDRKVDAILREQGFFQVCSDRSRYLSKAVLLCPGGRSYPQTGSDGSGFLLAKGQGHAVTAIHPALTPLITQDPDWKKLAGITLPCALSLSTDSGREIRFEGPFLFTHAGFSGPCVLNISRHWINHQDKTIHANFLPGKNNTSLTAEILQATAEHPRKTLKTWLSERLPMRLGEAILHKAGLDENPTLARLPKQQREALIRQICACPLPVKAAMGYQKAEVTSGGVDLAEVNPKTLESTMVPGLFFAGEVLDVDGPIGGTNLQWAWSSGFAAGQGIIKYLKQT